MQELREPPTTLLAIFDQRKDGFIDSLQHILQSIGSDLFIKQMFENKSSEVYVPDRIYEIITQNLNNDREKYINILEKRLRAIEACFGKERVKKFEEIGNNILDHSEKMRRMKNFNPNDKQNEIYFNMIQNEFKQMKIDSSTQADIKLTKSELDQLKYKIHSLNEIISSNSNFFNDAQNKFKSDFKIIFQQIKSTIKDSITNNEKKINLIKTENEMKANLVLSEKSEIERKISDFENQINFLKEQLNSKDEIIKSLQDDQQKSNQQFQLTLKQISKRDKEISDLQHSLTLLPNETDSNLMQQRIATLEADLEFSKSKLYEASQIKGEKNAMVESLRLIQEENSILKNQLTEKDLELNSCKHQIKEMRDTFIKLKESLPEKKRITDKIQQLQVKIKKLKLINDDQKSRIEDLQNSKSQLEQKCETLTENISEKTELIQKIRENINDSLHSESEKNLTINQLKEKIKEYDGAIKLLTKKVKQKQSQCSSLSKENKEIRNEMIEVKEKLKKAKEELDSTFDNLQSLKEENRSKDSIIDDFKSSLKKSSYQSRDLNSANIKINEQNSIIRSCEDANSQLMREISKQEEKIKEITKKFVDCDQNLKKQIQINFAQSKQNDTLSALNKKQENELKEAHSKITEMNSRLIQFESDSQTHSDSIKNLTNDNNREISERKLIESYIAQERERFHSEVNSLQKKISQLTVENTDLKHKLDQFSFENKTIKQLLEAREKELKFEKQKNVEDLRKMREITSKVLEENDRLRRASKSLNSSNAQILRDLSDSLINDKPQNDTFNSSSLIDFDDKNKENSIVPNDSENFVQSIPKEKEEMQNQLNQINLLLKSEKGNDVIDKLNKIKEENNELKEVHSKLQKICGNDDVLTSVSQMQKQNSFYQQQIENNNSNLIPDFDFKDEANTEKKAKTTPLEITKSLLNCNDINEIPKVIQKLNNENESLKNDLDSIKKVFHNQNNNNYSDSADEDIVSTITETLKENKRLKSQLLETTSDSNTNLTDSNLKIAKMKDESSSYQMIKNSLLKNSNNNNDNPTESNKDDNYVAKKVLEMQNNEAKLQEILHSNDIVSSVQDILKENEKLKTDEKNLSTMLNQSAESLNSSSRNKSNKEKISELIQQNSELKKTQKSIQNLLPASTQINSSFNSHKNSSFGNMDSFSLNLKAYKDQVSNLVNENRQLKQEKKEVEQLLRPFQNENDNESSNTINTILQENRKLKKIQKSACSLIGSKENDFESKIKELAETRKKIELILPQDEENYDLQTRVFNLKKENESLKQSMESISQLIPRKPRTRNQNITSPLATESEFGNNTILSSSIISNSGDLNEDTIEDVLKNYVEKNENLIKKMRKIKSIIPGHFNDIEEGIDNLIKENRKLKQDEIKARHAIPPFLAAKISKKTNNKSKGNFEIEEEEEDNEYNSLDYNEKLSADFPHLIEELAKELELREQQDDEISGILPGNRTDPVIDRLNKLINEKNSLEDNENEIREILSDFCNDDEDDVVTIVKNLSNKVRQLMKIIPFRSPKRFSSSTPNSPSGSPFGSPLHLFGLQSDSGSEKNFDFVSSVKRLVAENSQLEEIQREADELISENFSQNPNQSLVEKINSLLTSNAIFKSQQERLSKLIFPDSQPSKMSLENRIIEILTENQELKQTEAELNKLIPPEKQKKASLQENIKDILAENEQNASIKENVKKMLNEVMSPQHNNNTSNNNNSSPNKSSIIASFDFKSDDDDDENNDGSDLNSSKRSSNKDSCFSPGERIENKVQSIIKKKKQVENEIKQIEQLLPKNNSLSLQEKIKSLVDENQSLKQEKDQLQMLFSPSENLSSENNKDTKNKKSPNSKNLLSNVQSVLTTVEELKKILPEKETKPLPEAFHEIISENESLHKQKNELESLLKSSDSSVPSDLSTNLQKVLEENADLRKRLNRVMALFPGFLPTNFDDIIMQIRLLIENNLEMKQLRLDISRLLNYDNKRSKKQNQYSLKKLESLEKENMLLEIQNLVEQNQLLNKDRENLNKVKSILFNEIKNEEEDNDDDDFNSISVINEVQRILKRNNEFSNFAQQMFDLLRCDSLFELRQKIEDMKKNLLNTSELAQRLFDAIAAPSQSSPIRLGLPISEKRKASLFKLIDSFRKRLVESQQSVEDVIERARKTGFNGGTNDLHSAVQYLEEMAALAERTKLDEIFKQEFEELRDLNNKQQKMAEQNREKLKKKLQEKVALANELQEKLSEKEASFIQEVEIERKKARQFEITAEKQKRIISELIRVISGKGADLDFLKSNLNVSEAVALQYADAIHDLILKIHNDVHLVK